LISQLSRAWITVLQLLRIRLSMFAATFSKAEKPHAWLVQAWNVGQALELGESSHREKSQPLPLQVWFE
jgi:hypothetical protein